MTVNLGDSVATLNESKLAEVESGVDVCMFVWQGGVWAAAAAWEWRGELPPASQSLGPRLTAASQQSGPGRAASHTAAITAGCDTGWTAEMRAAAVLWLAGQWGGRGSPHWIALCCLQVRC